MAADILSLCRRPWEIETDAFTLPEWQERVDYLGRIRELGLARLVAFPGRWSVEAEAQVAVAEDCRAAGCAMHEPEPVAVSA